MRLGRALEGASTNVDYLAGKPPTVGLGLVGCTVIPPSVLGAFWFWSVPGCCRGCTVGGVLTVPLDGLPAVLLVVPLQFVLGTDEGSSGLADSPVVLGNEPKHGVGFGAGGASALAPSGVGIPDVEE